MATKKKIDVFPLENIVQCTSNLLHLEMVRRCPPKPLHKQETYLELKEVLTENGTEEKIIETPYPITADYVKSFEASADYKSDPVGAIANSPAKKNLGDLTKVQEISALDLTALEELQTKIGAVLKTAKEAQATPAEGTQATPAEGTQATPAEGV